MAQVPPVDHPSRLALFWFIYSHELEHGHAYNFTTLADLARATGLGTQNVKNALDDLPPYLSLQDGLLCTKGTPPLIANP
jgi:hypothetical protein